MLNKLVGDSSVWFKSIIYDLTERKVRILLVDDPKLLKVSRELVFSDIIGFDETIEAIEDDLIDSLLGIQWLEDAATICIKTEMREIFLKTTTPPYVKDIR